VASNVVFAWIVTLPAPALFGWLFYELGNFVFISVLRPVSHLAAP
jgi:phosphate/sulfate permease